MIHGLTSFKVTSPDDHLTFRRFIEKALPDHCRSPAVCSRHIEQLEDNHDGLQYLHPSEAAHQGQLTQPSQIRRNGRNLLSPDTGPRPRGEGEEMVQELVRTRFEPSLRPEILG